MAPTSAPREFYAAIDPVRYARNAVHVALGNGTMRKGERCALVDASCKGRMEAHHESYEPDRWLDVTWLCASHHRRRHPHR